jgi:hypothetical protein
MRTSTWPGVLGGQGLLNCAAQKSWKPLASFQLISSGLTSCSHCMVANSTGTSTTGAAYLQRDPTSRKTNSEINN